MKSMAEELRTVMRKEKAARPMLLALLERAKEGDLKAIQLVLDILGEKAGQDGEEQTFQVVLGPGVEELAK